MSNEKQTSENQQDHAPLAGVGGSSFQMVSDEKEFKFKGLCPYCGGDLTYRCDGWVEDDNGQWMADSMTSECSTEPDIESDEWEDWFSNHSDMPYVHQLPVDMRVQDWVNERYRFALTELPPTRRHIQKQRWKSPPVKEEPEWYRKPIETETKKLSTLLACKHQRRELTNPNERKRCKIHKSMNEE